MADLFKVAPQGISAIVPRRNAWIWIHGVADEGYTEQFAAADAWIVNHNLGRRPNVQVRTLGGAEVEVEVLHVSDNQVAVYFDVPMAGVVELS